MDNKTKYDRTVVGKDGREAVVDVYDVLKAFNVQCPARQHALKKMLCAGLRGKGDELQDLREAILATERSVELAGGVNGLKMEGSPLEQAIAVVSMLNDRQTAYFFERLRDYVSENSNAWSVLTVAHRLYQSLPGSATAKMINTKLRDLVEKLDD